MNSVTMEILATEMAVPPLAPFKAAGLALAERRHNMILARLAYLCVATVKSVEMNSATTVMKTAVMVARRTARSRVVMYVIPPGPYVPTWTSALWGLTPVILALRTVPTRLVASRVLAKMGSTLLEQLVST